MVINIGEQDKHIAAAYGAVCDAKPTDHEGPSWAYCTRPKGHKGKHTTIRGSFGFGGHLDKIWDDAGRTYSSIDYDNNLSVDDVFGLDEGRW
jgi:hypothetical protein